jgi:hypothetical protein
MAPPGARVVVHEKPKQHASWDPHGVDGCYIGQATDHYRCYRVHINKTKSDIIVDTLEFFPAKVAMPCTASKYMATIAAQELTHAIMHPAPAAPFSAIGGAQLEALRQLADIFDAALPRSATGSSVPFPSTETNNIPSTPFQLPSYPAPAYTTTPTPARRATGPTHAPPRMVPPPAPSPSVGPCIAPSPRVGPIRAPAPRVRPSQAPSPRVNPTPVPSPGVGPTRVTPAMQATPHQFRHHPPSPTSHTPSPCGSSKLGHGIPGTNLYGDFMDVVEEEHAPPQHRTRSQTARHSAHLVQYIPIANAVIHPTTGKFGRLTQGVGGCIEGSNTIYFIPRSAVPRIKTVTYGRFVVDVLPNKGEVHRVRLTVGRNLINYDGDVSTRSALLL